MAGTNPLRAIELAPTLENPHARRDAAQFTLMQLAPIDPDAATRETWLQSLAQSHLRNGEVRPLDAMRLASQLPAGEAPTAVFREAGSRWSEHDAPAARQWLAVQPAGAPRDAFLGEFVR